MFYQNDDKYSHLDKSDVERVAKVVEEKQAWLSDKTYLVNKAKLSDDPVVLASQIKDEKDVHTPSSRIDIDLPVCICNFPR